MNGKEMSMERKNGLWASACIVIFLFSNWSLADEYSSEVFSQHLGVFSGTFEDGTPCEMSVKENSWRYGFNVTLKEKNGTEAEGYTSCEEGRICTKEFKRKGVFKYYMEMFTGAGISSGGRNTITVYRVFTKSGRIHSFEVEKQRSGDRYTCQLVND